MVMAEYLHQYVVSTMVMVMGMPKIMVPGCGGEVWAETLDPPTTIPNVRVVDSILDTSHWMRSKIGTTRHWDSECWEVDSQTHIQPFIPGIASEVHIGDEGMG